MKGIDDLVSMIDGASTSIDSQEVLKCAIEEFGGAKGVAKEIFLNSAALEAGHSNRVKIILTVFQAMLDAAANQTELSDDPEVLKATLQQHLAEE